MAQQIGPDRLPEVQPTLSRAAQPAQPVKQFRFERAPWRAVLEWLADWAELELHVDTLPTGSFTYSSTRTYAADEAINRINLFLIPQRFSLVRSGNLLSVISLDDQRSIRQLDAMAVTVPLDELPGLGSHDLVKCLFPLGDTDPQRVVQELGGLMLIREPVVLRNTNQLLVTDTAAKLRMVRDVIAAISSPDPLIGPVKRFPLGELDAERVLTQVRPHVGLDPLAMIGADVRLSIDLEGNQLLASGSSENLDAVAGVLKMLESTAIAADPREPMDFRPHDLGEADMTTVVNVLNTLLADEDVRMSSNVRSNLIAIQGTAEVHGVVEQTIKDLTGSNAVQFRAISVRSVDPRYAAMVLGEMFAPPANAAAEGGLVLPVIDAPKIEADLLNNRLFVRARPAQIAKIERALAELEQPEIAQGSALRLLPYGGERGRRLLESAREFWPHGDELLILPPLGKDSVRPLELEIRPELPPRDLPADESRDAPDSEATDRADLTPTSAPASTSHVAVVDDRTQTDALPAVRDVPQTTDETPPQIRVQWTPRGLLVHSDDPGALERFERHVQFIAGPAHADNQLLAVFYLKHAEVDDANRLLQRVLDAEMDSLSLSAYAGGLSSGGMLENALGSLGIGASRIGSAWTAGTATIVPDTRLNRLFVYGTADDLTQIETHLEVIDRESSIAHVKTHGTPHVIQLEHARAQEVADILRDAYAGRIAASTKEIQAAVQQSQNQQPGRENQDQRGNQAVRPQQQPPQAALSSRQPGIKLAVDSPSNSLIVTAPEQLAQEIEQLARTIDERGAQTVRLIPVRGPSSAKVHETLKNLFGERIRSTVGESGGRRPQTP